ncbi:DUF3048 domain-containing protein [Neobacillus niacini]|uniref:DUF3048 domain-containing protein n=1 Tax=Neobacillus niacini TaxID=86668 RepID=UPI0021CB35F0|nr:DUF3048 domain-containing protein [Neobacillus niacini]MCM3766850.1 DUF3048 domain-containing protein [Neobacillus niacini]
MNKWAVAAAAVLLLLSGCNNNKETSTKPKEKEKVVDKVVEKEEQKQEVAYYFPLTGVKSEAQIDGRAVAVMINNHPKARPQSGISKADIVYELIAEGDMTRFLAVFQSQKPGNIGPVRSSRAYYIDLAKGLDALYIAHGYSEEARKLLESNYVDNLNGMVYDGTLFKRSSDRKAPHNSYITYENILKGVEQKHYSMDQTPPSFTFMKEEEKGNITGTEAMSAMVSYSKGGISNSIYEFDAASGKYKRFSGGDQTVDLETNEPVLLANIFIIEAPHQVYDEVGHLNVDLKSGGKGYLLQMGRMNEVTWENRNGRIVPVKDGAEVPLVPGQTWVNVLPTKPGITQSVSFEAQ